MMEHFKLGKAIENEKDWIWYDCLVDGRSYSVSLDWEEPYEAIRFEIYQHEQEFCCLFLFYYDADTQYFGVAKSKHNDYDGLLREAMKNSGIECTLPIGEIDLYDALGEFLLELDPEARVLVTTLGGELRTSE